MKVFLSWSGARSHKVALIFREWLPSVIQSIVPYVSSEDIDKGARWSTDIAKELEDSTFGILCVTRDNIGAPWLNFEAGALSKTMDKSLVVPFLFDIKRSEVNGPILQFQSTVFEQDDLRKLIKSLNKACDKEGLTHDRLERAFDLWYPNLNSELDSLREMKQEDDSHDASVEAHPRKQQEILEEILDLARDNQKLLRSPDVSVGPILEQLKVYEAETHYRNAELRTNRRRRIHPEMIRELAYFAKSLDDPFLTVQIVLSFFREELPWLYDAGIELARILRSRRSPDKKRVAVRRFAELLDFSLEHPMMREFVPERETRASAGAIRKSLELALDLSLDRTA
jgi:hypothetical protein